VKGYLLDTNVALIGLAAPERLPSHMLEALDGEPLYLSVLSYWEVLLKSMKGRLEVGEPRAWWLDALDKLGATPLPLRPGHISAIYDLPPIHQDPFDRALVAQALSEGLMLVTIDQDIPKYASERFRVLS
jgi:PIN domain nuclease of toxin-antitoxin system